MRLDLSWHDSNVGGMDSDDDFLDDGLDFDSIPAGTLLQLEQSAWQATQVPPPQSAERSHSTGLQTNRNQLNQRGYNLPPSQRHNSSFYGDVEVIDLDADILEDNDERLDDVVNSNPPVTQNVLHSRTSDQKQYTPVQTQHAQPAQGSNINYPDHEIGARIEEVSRQYDAINEQLAAAREDATKKAGEVAILRANLTKQAQEFERTITSLRAQLADLTTKNKGAQEAAIDERQKLETENLFLREELRDETLRVNNLRAKKRTEAPQTPRKQRTLPFRDGFDDDEIGFASPTKSSGGRSKRGTPTVPGKRKRKVSDAPIPMPPLQLSQGNQASVETDILGLDSMDTGTSERECISGQVIEEGFYMTQILNHRTHLNRESDLEVMAGLAFPSEPDRKISSIVLETMSGVTSNYAVKYAHCLIQLWDRALVEKFYKVVPVFMASIKFILLLDLYSISPQLITELAGILQASIYVNAATRFEHSAVSSKVKGESRRTPRTVLHTDVDSTTALEIMYLLVLACRQDDEAHEHLWRNIHFDILLMTLNDHQPLQDIVLSLKILSTSLRRNSFGTIQPSEAEQRQVEYHFIERVTCLLFQRIEPDEGEEDYLPLQICQMRLEALTFLEMITFYSFDMMADASKTAIISYPLVLPRLFRTLYDEMDRLYTLSPEHDIRTALVNRLMHLIFKLIRSGGGKNLNEGLSRLAGAKQKHRLVLSRLAFSEGQFLESGITEETMEMARQLLEEEDMSPEEAEALFVAFPTGGRLSGKEGTQVE
ncbi:DNA repair protein Rad26, putative [Talaromyces stipitatus ATCC 10500]|uniref:DNA repair protein Rad26, putative n=1 Tax=Talaromyces stipitatus (strain ATCC 10500 / CBS 375.48 / QM 6759 / NRRL 1006) TaxID=441959 RepID=B8MLC3_TALSN|nr:DNA repair protein Rad26, putative [Talaromyces stipitatus ATCC 10500]EED15038.1 DNA repair protein Rad26, putative [Talaromyces stipitatus ATCC 10500]